MNTTKIGIMAMSCAAFALAACNDSGFVPEDTSGSGGSGNAAAIEGGYGGFFSGSNSNDYRLLLTATEVWAAYGAQDSLLGFQATGLFQASGEISGKTYTGNTAYQYIGLGTSASGTAAATYDDSVQPPLLNGNFTIGSNIASFSAGPIVGASFNYATAAALSTLAGTWPVTDVAGVAHTLVVTALDGSFTLDSGAACSATGLFTPVTGRNAYTDEITFSAGCDASLAGKTLQGVAFDYSSDTPAGTQLIAMFRDVTGNTVGYVLNGVK